MRAKLPSLVLGLLFISLVSSSWTGRGDSSMIVISRRKNESIVIGDDIEVTVVDILEDLVELGVETPIDVPVHRREVYEAIRQSEQIAED
jgi:carbon storage regulator